MNYTELQSAIRVAQRTNDPTDWQAVELDLREHFQQVALLQAELALFRFHAAMKEVR